MREEDIIEYLRRKELLNVDMIDCIKQNRHRIIKALNNGVLLEDKLSNVFMISADNIEAAKELIVAIPECAELIIGHEYSYYEELKNNFKPNNEMHCYPAVYTKKDRYEIKYGDIECRVLDEKYLEDIIKYYSNDVCDREYVTGRVLSKSMYGAFLNNKLCGFIGNHEEGSIGLLEVITEYRKMGIGSILQKFATNVALDEGRIPYGQIKDNNLISMKLQDKLGYTIADEKIYWLFK